MKIADEICEISHLYDENWFNTVTVNFFLIVLCENMEMPN